MEWNVYYHNINRQTMSHFNVFDHGGLTQDIIKITKKYKDKDTFCKELKRSIMYWFWSKSEWEILIYPWVGGKDGIQRKIDVFSQIMLNWHIFSEYVWKNRKEFK